MYLPSFDHEAAGRSDGHSKTDRRVRFEDFYSHVHMDMYVYMYSMNISGP